MSDPLAVIALASAAISPVVLVVVTTRERRSETRESWRRQDDVAERLLAATDAAALVATETRARLEQIHTLVNSELSEAQRRELAATEALLARAREVVELKATSGTPPTVADEDGLLELEIRIAGMTRGLAAKDAATAAAAAERAATSPEAG